MTETIAQVVARAVILAVANVTTLWTVSTFGALGLTADASVTGATQTLSRDGIACFGRPLLALARLFAVQTETAFRTGGIACVILESGAARTFAWICFNSYLIFPLAIDFRLKNTCDVMTRSPVFAMALLLAVLTVESCPAGRLTEQT